MNIAIKTSLNISMLFFVFYFNHAIADDKTDSDKSFSREVDYKEINALLYHIKHKTSSKFVKVDQKMVINSDNTAANELTFSDLRVWVSHKDDILYEITIDPEGLIDLPLLDENIASEANLNLNQPSGTVSLNLSIGVKPPTEYQVSYHELFILLKDTNDFIDEMGGSFSWLAPSMDELSFTFSESASITIKTKRKTYHYSTDAELKIEIPVKRRLMKEDPIVEFSHLPLEMTPID